MTTTATAPPAADRDHIAYDLLTEPWIPLADHTGQLSAGILETLTRAHEVRLAAPGMENIALFRLLAAVLDAACGPATTQEWDAAWRAPALDTDRIRAYLDTWRDRFDLFHPSRPFHQSAAPAAPNRSTHTLWPQSWGGNGDYWFHEPLRHDPQPWEPARAAVALLMLQAWNPGGIQSAAPGDARAKQGKVYGGRSGPLGLTTHFSLTTQRSLKDDLLLALPPQPRADGDIPVWERPARGAVGTVREPAGRLDQLTWPTRTVRLHHAPGTRDVTGVSLQDGDRSPDSDPRAAIHRHDPMTARSATGYPLALRDDAHHEMPWAAATVLDGGSSPVLDHAIAATDRGVLDPGLLLRAVVSATQHTTKHHAAIADVLHTTHDIGRAGQLADPRTRAVLAAAVAMPREILRRLNREAADIVRLSTGDLRARTTLNTSFEPAQAWQNLARDPAAGLEQWITTLLTAARSTADDLPQRTLMSRAQLSVKVSDVVRAAAAAPRKAAAEPAEAR